MDCFEFMEKLPDESISMVMTSPPYWGLRDYGIPGQIGLESTWQEYVDRLKRVGEEIMRVLKKDGSFYLNLGDTFHDKMKLGIPWRVRFALNKLGWISRADIVWHKPNAMPSSVKDRLNCTYEMLFHFVKSKKYYFDLDVIREPHKSAPLEKHQKTTTKLQQFLTSSVKNKSYKGKFKGMGLNAERFGSPRARTQRIYRGIPTNPPHRSAYGDYWSGINPHMKNHPKGKNPGDVFSFKHHGSTLYTPENRRTRGTDGWLSEKGKNPGDIFHSDSKFLKFNVKTASPGGRGIRVIKEGKLTTFVRERILNVGAHLKQKLKESGYSTQQLADIIGIKKTTLDHYFRTDFTGQAIPSRAIWEKLKPLLNLGEYDDFVNEEIRSALPQPHPLGRNPGDFFSICTKPFKGAHFSVYPEALCVKPILSSSRPGDVVLDPFIGSGTTAVVAKKLGRRFLGCDINPEYVKIAEKRLNAIGNFNQER